MQDTPLIIGSRSFQSRLLVGTGKYKDLNETDLAIQASGAEIVTVAIRRVNIGQNPDQPNLLSVIPPEKYTILPNTAGCFDADSAVRTCMLARELLDGHNLVKLEVLGDEDAVVFGTGDYGGLVLEDRRVVFGHVLDRIRREEPDERLRHRVGLVAVGRIARKDHRVDRG